MWKWAAFTGDINDVPAGSGIAGRQSMAMWHAGGYVRRGQAMVAIVTEVVHTGYAEGLTSDYIRTGAEFLGRQSADGDVRWTPSPFGAPASGGEPN